MHLQNKTTVILGIIFGQQISRKYVREQLQRAEDYWLKLDEELQATVWPQSSY